MNEIKIIVIDHHRLNIGPMGIIIGDDLTNVLLFAIQIERLTNEILEGLLSNKENLTYDLKTMNQNPKIKLLGTLGLDPKIVGPMKAFVILRNKFAHHSFNRKSKLDAELLKPIIESLKDEEKKLFNDMDSQPSELKKALPHYSEERLLENKYTIKLLFCYMVITNRLICEKERLLK